MRAFYLCPEPADANLNFQFGPQPRIVQKSPAVAFAKYLLTTDGFSEEIRFDDRNRWIGDRLPKAGNYVVLGTNPDKQETTLIHKFSVNDSARKAI